MKTILSLFDCSGNWPAPWDHRADVDVIHCDIKNPTPIDVAAFSVANLIEELGIEDADAIIAAPPCTHFTAAGAQFWKAKDEDGRTEEALELARQVLRTVDLYRPDWWVLENPVGRLARLMPEIGRPSLIFHPCDYAGWVTTDPADLARLEELRARNGEGQWTAEEIAFVRRTNAYTKGTCLWGNFQLPEKRRIEPVRVCKQGSWLQKLGGSRESTKAARSETPLGFAQAFAVANDWTPAALHRIELARMLDYAVQLCLEPAEAADEVAAEFGFDRVTRAEFLAALPAAALAA